ncbi:MAG: hypothetical protein B9S33_02400 [Pedosphaera sp. Tous-C6FEB]|nr:MAG: hypothetical protein B9S33_02400 [Pedosphaera sp. Tous-C6FEB]
MPLPLLNCLTPDLLARWNWPSGTPEVAAGGLSLLAALLLAAVALAAISTLLAVLLAYHLFYCYCLKRICEKAGHPPGLLVWMPLLNRFPQLAAVKLPAWMFLLYLVPLVSLGMAIVNWVKLCEVRNQPGALAILYLVPFGRLGLAAYLAFTD